MHNKVKDKKELLDYRSRSQISVFLISACVICVVYYTLMVVGQDKVPVQQQMNEFLDSLKDVENKVKHGYSAQNLMYPPLQRYSANIEYPKYDNLLNIVTNWNPDDPVVPEDFSETLLHFNYSNPIERQMALEFREAELPFKVYDVPELKNTQNLWTDEYLTSEFRSVSPHVEKSASNHFMYWNMRTSGRTKNWKPPTEIVRDMKFPQWLELAKAADEKALGPDSAHFYFMTGSAKADRKRKSHFVARDLPMFSDPNHANFFISAPEKNKGIQCRFGMRGVAAASHYDCGKNMIALLKGSKRYIINPPHTCKRLSIIPDISHPSYRHSTVDWSNLEEAKASKFDQVDAIDTVVKAGEVLYLPSYWMHYVISLEYSIQCNSRSGTPPGRNGEDEINMCMGKDQFMRGARKRHSKEQ